MNIPNVKNFKRNVIRTEGSRLYFDCGHIGQTAHYNGGKVRKFGYCFDCCNEARKAEQAAQN